MRFRFVILMQDSHKIEVKYYASFYKITTKLLKRQKRFVKIKSRKMVVYGKEVPFCKGM